MTGVVLTPPPGRPGSACRGPAPRSRCPAPRPTRTRAVSPCPCRGGTAACSGCADARLTLSTLDRRLLMYFCFYTLKIMQDSFKEQLIDTSRHRIRDSLVVMLRTLSHDVAGTLSKITANARDSVSLLLNLFYNLKQVDHF